MGGGENLGQTLEEGKIMPTNLELRVAQKDKLFTLHKIKRLNERAGVAVIGLDNEIVEAEAVMEQEDVALVKDKVAELV